MTGYLTTHVLDTAMACPEDGIECTLARRDSHDPHDVTTGNRRTVGPVLPMRDVETDRHAPTFHSADCLADESFPSDIATRIATEECGHHHVPPLYSPCGYLARRGG